MVQIAWVAPSTWVAGNVLTAAQLNQQLRDNMLQTSPALATSALGQIFVGTGANSIAARLIGQTEVLTSESTSSTSYTALTTAQAVTVTTGTQALVIITAQWTNATVGNQSTMSYAISGASTIAISDNWALTMTDAVSNAFVSGSRIYLHTGLTAGSNTFTTQYKSSAATAANFRNRVITVIPL